MHNDQPPLWIIILLSLVVIAIGVVFAILGDRTEECINSAHEREYDCIEESICWDEDECECDLSNGAELEWQIN